MAEKRGNMADLARNEQDGSARFEAELLALGNGYHTDLTQYIGFCREQALSVGMESLATFKGELIELGYKAPTVNKKLAAVRSSVAKVAGKHLKMKELQILKQALREVKGIKLAKGSKVVAKEKLLRLADVQRLLEGASERTGLAIQFLFSTGIRVSELCGIRGTDLKERDHYFQVRVLGKGEKERRLKVDKRLVERVREAFCGKRYLFETKGGKPYLRQYVSAEIVKAGRRILGRSISAHTLRHSFATLKIARTGKIKGVSEYLGHSSTAITLDMYVHEELSMEDLDLF